jgi:hypothetical protein
MAEITDAVAVARKSAGFGAAFAAALAGVLAEAAPILDERARRVLERAAKLTRFQRMSWLRLWYGTAWGG